MLRNWEKVRFELFLNPQRVDASQICCGSIFHIRRTATLKSLIPQASICMWNVESGTIYQEKIEAGGVRY